MITRATSSLAAIVFVSACSNAPPSATCEPSAEPILETAEADDDTLLAAYLAGLEVAAHPTADRVSEQLLVLDRNDASLTWDEAGRLLVTTWTRSKYYTAPEYVTGHEFALYSETWFTTGTQVQDACASAGTGDALVLRLEQLLGLPPASGYDSFLQVWVDPAALIRPCDDPRVSVANCGLTAPLRVDAQDVAWDCAAPADAHDQWMCNSWVSRYAPSNPLRRYPWTALGYTFDWSPDSATGEGPSEFVAAGKTPVVFERLLTTEAFCVTDTK